jgi:hypothetical protein
MRTCAPASCRRSTMPHPMPIDPRVTIAVLPPRSMSSAMVGLVRVVGVLKGRMLPDSYSTVVRPNPTRAFGKSHRPDRAGQRFAGDAGAHASQPKNNSAVS